MTAASAVNTAVLFAMLGKTKGIEVAPLVKSIAAYAIKISVFSAAASIPVFLSRKIIVEFFAGHTRIISHGIPVAITSAVFGTIGIALLAATKDSIVRAAVGKLKRR